MYMKNKLFNFDGSNQDSLAAWVMVDTPDYEHQNIKVEDNHGSYCWYRKNSNDNVRGDIAKGKGFSLFLARYAYLDNFKYQYVSFNEDINSSIPFLLASIPFRFFTDFDSIKNDNRLVKILTPSNSILLLIGTDSENIVSAVYTNKEEYILAYIENKAKKLTEAERNHPYTKWLGEKTETAIIQLLYSKLTQGYSQFKEFLEHLY